MLDEDAQLNARLAALRSLAIDIEVATLDLLRRGAGDDVWRGPTAVAFRDDLDHVRAVAIAAEESVRAEIQRLEAVIERRRQERIRAGIRS